MPALRPGACLIRGRQVDVTQQAREDIGHPLDRLLPAMTLAATCATAGGKPFTSSMVCWQAGGKRYSSQKEDRSLLPMIFNCTAYALTPPS